MPPSLKVALRLPASTGLPGAGGGPTRSVSADPQTLGGGFSMKLSSRRGVRCGGLIGRVVAQHGPQDVEASAGQGEDGLGVGFAFESFAVVVGARGGVGADGDVSGQVAGAQQAPVVAAGAFEVAVYAPGVARHGGQSGYAGEAVGGIEQALMSPPVAARNSA